MDPRPTEGALRRFQGLPPMRPARVAFPSLPEGSPPLADIEGTVIDISPGGVCLRVPMDGPALEVMPQVEEGLFVELTVDASEQRRFTALGRIAWLWVPSMEGEDLVGSLGVDVKGVAEEDRTFLGRIRKALSREPEVEVDRSSRIIRTRAPRRVGVAEAAASPSPPPGDAEVSEEREQGGR